MKLLLANSGPSLHLSWKELGCKDGTPYPTEWRTNRAIQLAEVFELLRKICGNQPLQILSAYRTPAHNKSIGGAQNSQHMQGRALDIKPPIGFPLRILYNHVYELAGMTAIRGIGMYPTFVHIDIRPTERLIAWNGKGLKDDSPRNA